LSRINWRQCGTEVAGWAAGFLAIFIQEFGHLWWGGVKM
jgi:hypothetical protein